MIKTLRYKTVTIRKPHVCFGCGRQFEPPCKMISAADVDCGTVNSYYLCATCAYIVSDMQDGDGFCYGDLRDEALEHEIWARFTLK